MVLLGCEFSLLSSVPEIGKIRPEILLVRMLNNANGDVQSEIRVTLYNEQNHDIEIDSGGVEVNGVEMSPPYHPLFFGEWRDYYYLQLPVKPDSLYEIIVITSEVDRAHAWVRAPRTEITQIIIPEKQHEGSNLLIQ